MQSIDENRLFSLIGRQYVNVLVLQEQLQAAAQELQKLKAKELVENAKPKRVSRTSA